MATIICSYYSKRKSTDTGIYINCPFIPKVVQESKGSTFNKALEGRGGWTRLIRDALRSKANAPARRQGSFDWSTLHLAFYWLGNFDRVIAQRIWEQSRNLRADVSRAHRSSLCVKRRAEAGAGNLCKQQYIWVQAYSLSRSRANLSASRGYLSLRGINKSCSQIERHE